MLRCAGSPPRWPATAAPSTSDTQRSGAPERARPDPTRSNPARISAWKRRSRVSGRHAPMAVRRTVRGTRGQQLRLERPPPPDPAPHPVPDQQPEVVGRVARRPGQRRRGVGHPLVGYQLRLVQPRIRQRAVFAVQLRRQPPRRQPVQHQAARRARPSTRRQLPDRGPGQPRVRRRPQPSLAVVRRDGRGRRRRGQHLRRRPRVHRPRGAPPPGETGSAIGFNHVLRTIGFSAGSALTGLVLAAATPTGAALPLDRGYTAAALIGAAFLLVTAVLLTVIRPRRA